MHRKVKPRFCHSSAFLLSGSFSRLSAESSLISETREKLCVSAAGTTRINASIEVGRRFHVDVAKQLPDAFVRAWIRVQNDFRCEMAKLVRCQLYPQRLVSNLFYRKGNCCCRSGLSGGG
jgi:hypothetical protein